jgi:hypothetical protein
MAKFIFRNSKEITGTIEQELEKVVWIRTEEGLYCFDKADIKQVKEDKKQEKEKDKKQTKKRAKRAKAEEKTQG